MSKKDFAKYRRSFNYALPSPEEAKNKPYGVVASGVYGKYFTNLDYYNDEIVDSSKKATIFLLNTLYKKEKIKEKNFLQSMLKEIENNDKEFFKIIKPVVASGNFSKAFTLIKHRQNGLYNIKLNYQTNLNSIAEQWAESQNKAFIEAFNKAIGGGKEKKIEASIKNNFLNKTFYEIIEDARRIFMEDVNDKIDIQLKTNLHQVWDLFDNYIADVLDSKGLMLHNTVKDYYTLLNKNNFKSKVKVENISNIKKNVSVEEITEKILNNFLINGLSAELFLSANGAKHTGKAKKKYTSLLGNKTTGSIQSDAIELVSFDLTLQTNFKEDINKILKENKKDIDKKLNKLINVYSEDNFIIHYSSKDIAKDSSEKRIQIRDSSSFDYRIQELKTIANIVKGKDIDNLIFGLVNLHKGLVAQSYKEDIRESIVALCAAWMFEDYKETFTQIKEDKSNNRLHCYFISGNYYLMSDILHFTLEKIERLITGKLVSTSITLSDHDIYGKIKKEGQYFGIDRWEQVRREALKQGKINIRMNTELLEKLILTI